MTGRRNVVRWIAAVLVLGLAGVAAPRDTTVAELVDQLKSADTGTRARAAMALAQAGAGAKVAVPALAVAAADNNLNVRYWAISALKRLGPDAKAGVTALTAALKTLPGGSPALEGPSRYYADVRSVAAEALGAIGPAAREAVPALQAMSTDENPAVRDAAAAAVEKIMAR